MDKSSQPATRRYYQRQVFIFASALVFIVLSGSYANSIKAYGMYASLGILLICVTIVLLRALFLFYEIDFFPTSTASLLDKYELTNTRFLSTNDYIRPAAKLASQLISRSNSFIYIYTGHYNPIFYTNFKYEIEARIADGCKVCIISQYTIEKFDIIPPNVRILEGIEIHGYNHFIVTDYGLRYELSDLNKGKTKATFAMNLINAKEIEPDITDLHSELKTVFEQALLRNGVPNA